MWTIQTQTGAVWYEVFEEPSGCIAWSFADGVFVICDNEAGPSNRTSADAALAAITENVHHGLETAFEKANSTVFRLGEMSEPPVSATAIVFQDDGVQLANLGLNQVYVVQGNHLSRLTRDDSVASEFPEWIGNPDRVPGRILGWEGVRPDVHQVDWPQTLCIGCGDCDWEQLFSAMARETHRSNYSWWLRTRLRATGVTNVGFAMFGDS